MLTEKGTRRVELARVLEENDTTARLMHAAVATWHMLRPIQVDTNSHRKCGTDTVVFKRQRKSRSTSFLLDR
jgi:hypothetical protein